MAGTPLLLDLIPRRQALTPQPSGAIQLLISPTPLFLAITQMSAVLAQLLSAQMPMPIRQVASLSARNPMRQAQIQLPLAGTELTRIRWAHKRQEISQSPSALMQSRQG